MAYLSTVAAFGFEDFHPPTLLKKYQQLGCRSCQFYRNTANPPDPDQARKLTDDLGIPFDSVHGVFGPQYDPSSPDETTRRAAIEAYRVEGELALQLGGPMVVVHPAPRAAVVCDLTGQTRALRIAPMKQSIEELAQIGQRQGITYLIENIPHDYFFGDQAPDVAQFIRKMDSANLRMCFDTGHANLTGHAADDLDSCRDVVRYLHVNDNDGKMDSHLIPGKGTIDWKTLADAISKLPPDIPAMLELFEPEAVIEQQINLGLGEKLRYWLALQ